MNNYNKLVEKLKQQHQRNGWEINEQRIRQQAWMLNDRLMNEASLNNGSAAAAAAGAGGGGSGNRRNANANTVVDPFLGDSTILVFISPVTNNLCTIQFNFSTQELTDILDTGISSNDCNITDYYYTELSDSDNASFKIIYKGGFLMRFTNQNTNSSTFLFLNTNNEILQSCQISSNQYLYFSSKLYVHFYDVTNQIMYIFDGKSVVTSNLTNNSFNSLVSNWDNLNIDGSFLYRDANNNYCLLDKNGVVHVLWNLNTNGDTEYVVSADAQQMTNYVVMVIGDNNSGNYKRIDFFSSTGTLLNSVDLTGQGYNTDGSITNIWSFTNVHSPAPYSPQFYGNNQAQLDLINSDTNQPYLFVNFDGVNSTTHTSADGSNYGDIDMNFRTKYFYQPTTELSYFSPGSILNLTYNDSSSGFSGFSLDRASNNVKLVYKFDSDNVYRDYTFNTPISWSWNFKCSKDIILFIYSDAANVLKLMVLKPGGVDPIIYQLPEGVIYEYIYSDIFGEYIYILYQYTGQGPNIGKMTIFDFNLTPIDSLEDDLGNNYYVCRDIGQQIVYMANNVMVYLMCQGDPSNENSNSNKVYYFNKNSNGFQQLNLTLPVSNYYSSNLFDTYLDGAKNGAPYDNPSDSGVDKICLIGGSYTTGSDSVSFRILNQDNITDEISLPINNTVANGYNVFAISIVGFSSKYITYLYRGDLVGDPDSNNTLNGITYPYLRIQLYDLNGNLINDYQTNYTKLIDMFTLNNEIIFLMNKSMNSQSWTYNDNSSYDDIVYVFEDKLVIQNTYNAVGPCVDLINKFLFVNNDSYMYSVQSNGRINYGKIISMV